MDVNRRLPEIANPDTEDGRGPPDPLPMVDQGAGYAALGPSGYADDTQAVALGAAALQATTPATEEWLRVTGQNVRMDKSCSWMHGEERAPTVLLHWQALPVADRFR